MLSFVRAGEFLVAVIAFSSRIVNPEMAPDECPDTTWRFTHLVLPLVEMADKEGQSVHEKVSTLFDIYNIQHGMFYSVTSDGGVEITGNSREEGLGPKGMFYKGFHPHGATWVWCKKHQLQLVFGDTDLSLVHNQLNTVSRFLRCAKRMNKLKPHGMLVLKHMKNDNDSEDNMTEYHKKIAESMAELSEKAQEDQSQGFEKVDGKREQGY